MEDGDMDYLFLVLGLIGLFAGGEALVRGAVGIAQRLAMPPMLIGLTVVGFGTSTPELLVSVDAALRGVGLRLVLVIFGLVQSVAISHDRVGLRCLARKSCGSRPLPRCGSMELPWQVCGAGFSLPWRWLRCM